MNDYSVNELSEELIQYYFPSQRFKNEYHSFGYFFFSKMTDGVRLYTKARFLGYKRSKVAQRVHTSLLNLEGVKSKEGKLFIG